MSCCPAPGRPDVAPPLPAWASRPDFAWTGVGVATCIIAEWALLLRHALCLDVAAASGVHFAAVFAALIFAYTGLFITAHDAMHSLVAPSCPALNRTIGQLCALLFAGFNYDALHTAHWQHHARPATPKARDGSWRRHAPHQCIIDCLLLPDPRWDKRHNHTGPRLS